MKATLALNHKDQLALFYDAPLATPPNWASIDAELGEIYLGNDDGGDRAIKLDKIEASLYEKIKTEQQILLICVDEGGEPRSADIVPLMVSRQS